LSPLGRTPHTQEALPERLLGKEEGEDLTSHLLLLPHELQSLQQHPLHQEPCSANNGKSKYFNICVTIKIIQDSGGEKYLELIFSGVQGLKK
jgi:hypothetical protein